MKPTFHLLALPCCLTLIGVILPLSSLSAKDAAEKPKAKAAEKAKPAPAKEAEEEEEEATAEDFILANIGVLDNMEAAANLLETVKDVKTAKIASAKLKKLSAELQQAFEELNDLGAPNEEVTAELEKEKKLPARAEKVAAHFKASTEALTALEDKAALQAIAPTLQEYGTIAKTAGKGEEVEEEEATPADKDKTPATLADAVKLSASILDNMDHAAEILEGITDADSAKEATPELDKATAALKAIVKQAKAMGELAPEDKKKMDNNPKLTARGQKVGARFQAAAQGLSELDDKTAAAAIAPSLMNYGKAAQSLNDK